MIAGCHFEACPEDQTAISGVSQDSPLTGALCVTNSNANSDGVLSQPAFWPNRTDARTLLAQRPRLLNVRGDGNDSDPEFDDEALERCRRRCRKACKCFAIGTPIIVVIGLIIGFTIPWGHDGYNPKLIEFMNKLKEDGKIFTSSCLYKQYNIGGNFSGPEGLGLNVRHYNNKTQRSPDILYYHHQGNLMEISWGNRTSLETEWLQLSFNQRGLYWRITWLPIIHDTIRWNKECYAWCGSLSPEMGDPLRFQAKLREMQGRPYNGFLLNCLQFSTELFDALEPQNKGCMPKRMVENYIC